MLAFMGAVSACVQDDYEVNDVVNKKTSKEGLAILPIVSEPSVQVATTRDGEDSTTPSIPDLKEDYLHTLDVFVVNTEEPDKIIKQYHLTSVKVDANGKPDLNWLADRWRNELSYVDGNKYNVYVSANNPLTHPDEDHKITTVAALKELVYNEKNLEIAKLDADGNIGRTGTASTDPISGNIYKMYKSPSTTEGQTADKEFIMDGVLKDWEPDETSLDQVFDKVELNRAAAKIVLNVKFDDAFKTKLANEGFSITGTPAWKFNNFAFGAPVFAPATAGDGVEVHSVGSGLNIIETGQNIDGGKNFSIVTYSYPNKWESTTDAPSLLVSVGYKQGTGETATTSYNYYRIPIVPKATKALNRNHIYVINATIATRGSETHEDVTEIGNLEYEVLPWNDKNNSDVMENTVTSIQHYYLNVSPKVYTLRGDGEQTLIINFSKATGTKVNWKLFTYNSQGNQTGIVANDNTAATRAWFYNSEGAFTTTYSDNSGIDWSKMGVDIVPDRQGVDYSTGTITVTSQALTNKAIKYIRLRVYLDEVVDGQSLENAYHEDIIIRHFPTDNIQNIAGSWSSRHTTDGTSTPITLTTTVLSVAQSWADEYGVEFVTHPDVSKTDYISYAQYAPHIGEAGYAASNTETVTSNNFRNFVQNNAQRANANGQNNGVVGEDGYCYWGVNPTLVEQTWYSPSSTYDYYTTRTYNGVEYPYYYYRYANRYRARYTHSYTQTEYSVTVNMPATGQWVDWERDAGKTYNQADVKYTRGNNFTAKVYDKSRSRIYAIEPTRSGGWTNYQYTYDIADGYDEGDYYVYTTGGDYTTSGNMDLTNYHMYVIQISSTSDEYVLGRPYVNQDTHRSQDNVVSPSFMIASQLGAVTQFTGNNAATNAANHCDQYMEVASDGTRYTGWRLPTQAEIKVIVGYQDGTINNITIPTAYQTIIPVLTGERYWCLSGNRINTRTNQIDNTGNAYLRCVRDLSAEEVDRQNGFTAIIEKYQNQN